MKASVLALSFLLCMSCDNHPANIARNLDLVQSPIPKFSRSMPIGATVGTCSFEVREDGSIWLADSHYAENCIKVRRDPDGFVAIVKRGNKYEPSHDLIQAVPVVRIEWEDK